MMDSYQLISSWVGRSPWISFRETPVAWLIGQSWYMNPPQLAVGNEYSKGISSTQVNLSYHYERAWWTIVSYSIPYSPRKSNGSRTGVTHQRPLSRSRFAGPGIAWNRATHTCNGDVPISFCHTNDPFKTKWMMEQFIGTPWFKTI